MRPGGSLREARFGLSAARGGGSKASVGHRTNIMTSIQPSCNDNDLQQPTWPSSVL